MSETLATIRVQCAQLGLELRSMGNGHYQIHGGRYLVNFYPRTGTAYVQGMSHGIPVKHKNVASLANVPIKTKAVKRRQGGYRKVKCRMLRRDSKCHYCRCNLTEDTATVDHFIPLSKGGLDNPNNRVLACDGCNKGKADAMPEKSLVFVKGEMK